MSFLKTLISVNKVKFQLDKILKMLMNINDRVMQLEDDVSILKKEAHPPIFTKKQYSSIDERIQYIEAFINNLEKITFNEKDIAN